MLLADAMGTDRLTLYTGFDKLVEPRERDRFREMVKRRARREPVAYILGRKEFYSLPFEVTPAVLVPRPETEHVVDAALEGAAPLSPRPAGAGAALNVLDLGTGSGNLAVAIARERRDSTVDAVDTSSAALEVARRNAVSHEVSERVRLHRGDLFRALGEPRPRYHVIVSNPPYVTAAEFDTLMPEVRLHEPREALVDTKSPEPDGLGFYRELAREAPRWLLPGGALVVEVGNGQSRAVEELFLAAGLLHTKTVTDYGGIPRVVVAGKRS